MSSHKKRRYENCTLCENRVTYAQKANNANKLEASEVLERIKQFNRGGIIEERISTFVMCETCRDEVDTAYKRVTICQEYLTGQPSAPPQQTKVRAMHFQDAITQTESPQQTIIINGLPAKADQKEMEDEFSGYGNIVNFYLKTERSEDCDIFACIKFSNENEALKMMNAAQNKNLWYQQECLRAVTLVSEDSSPIDILPDVCLSEIFLYLDDVEDKIQIARVCKRWKKVLPSSWSNITRFSNFSEMNDIASVRGLKSILKGCGRFLESLEFNVLDNPMTRMRLMRKYCKNIKNLQLNLLCDEEIGEYQDEVLSMFQKCAKLQRLFIDELDKGFNFKYLEHLPVGMLEFHLYSEDIDIKLSFDLTKFKNLEALALYTFSIDEDSLIGLETLMHLKFLSLETSRVHSSNIRKIVNFEKLTHLAIPDCELDDEMLSQIARKNLNLEYLDISDNPGITDRSFQYITHLPKLKTLYMKNLSEVTASDWMVMRTLETLDVEGCTSISDWTLSLLIDKSLKLDIVYAAGVSSWRLLMNANVSLDMRGDNKSLLLHTEENLVRRWNSCGIVEPKLCVTAGSRARKVDPLDWAGWYGNVRSLP